MSIEVTVICLAFNHEAYIKDALDGFVSQKTTFTFEVIVHDDASTDRTTEIIREYAQKYPDIIKPIYEKENLYSKKDCSLSRKVYSFVKGKYIATCDGDDYWIDNLKLQKQYDYMERHPDCAFCFSDGYVEDAKEKTKRVFMPYTKKDEQFFDNSLRIYTLNDYFFDFIPTPSFFYRSILRAKFPNSFYRKIQAGDLKTRLYCMAFGYAYFLSDKTCVYRKNVPNSAMTNWKKMTDSDEIKRLKKQFIDLIEDVNSFTSYRYKDSLFKIEKDHIFTYLLHTQSLLAMLRLIKSDPYKRFFNEASAKTKAKLIICNSMPFLLKRYKGA